MMDTSNESDAIQKDVSGEQEITETTENPTDEPQESPTQEPSEPPLSPREETMNRIVESREQGFGEEVQESEQADRAIPSESLQTLKIKVDGIEQEIPIEQATAVVQKNLAADKRLNDAVLKQQQLNQWEQQLKGREETLLSTTVPQAKPTEDLKKQIQTVVDKLYDGDTDEAVEALTSVVSGRDQTATLDADRISAKATEKVMQALRQREFSTEVEQGKQQFVNEYQQIANDPELYNLADRKTIDLMQQYPDWTPTRVIMEAGRQTEEWVNGIKSGNGAQQSRQERKAQLQSLPRSQGSVAYQPQEPRKSPVTPQEVIADMQQARGQA